MVLMFPTRAVRLLMFPTCTVRVLAVHVTMLAVLMMAVVAVRRLMLAAFTVQLVMLAVCTAQTLMLAESAVREVIVVLPCPSTVKPLNDPRVTELPVTLILDSLFSPRPAPENRVDCTSLTARSMS